MTKRKTHIQVWCSTKNTKVLKVIHLVFQPWSFKPSHNKYISLSVQVAQWEPIFFNKTTFLVIKRLSLFDHSNISQFKVMETCYSRFFQKIKKGGKTPFFFVFPKTHCSPREITSGDNTFIYN